MKELCSINLLRAPARNIHKYMLLSWNLNPNYFHKFFMETNSPHVYIRMSHLKYEIILIWEEIIYLCSTILQTENRVILIWTQNFPHVISYREDEMMEVKFGLNTKCFVIRTPPLAQCSGWVPKYADVISIHPKSVDS